jgi:hypothetical protein
LRTASRERCNIAGMPDTRLNTAMTHLLPNTDAAARAVDQLIDRWEPQPVALTLMNAGNVVWWLQQLTLMDAAVRELAQLERRPVAFD